MSPNTAQPTTRRVNTELSLSYELLSCVLYLSHCAEKGGMPNFICCS
jgi:hypothetical protein